MNGQLPLPEPASYIEPGRIRNHRRLLDLFFRVRQLTRNRKGYCWAGNESLAAQLGCSVDTITRLVARLVALGAIAVEHIVGVERRIRVLLSPEALKARLFRGAEPNRRPSFCPRRAEGSAEPVAEGQYRVAPEGSLPTDLSKGERTTNTKVGSGERRFPVVVPSPPADPAALAALTRLGIAPRVASRIAASQPAQRVRHAVRAVESYLARVGHGNAAALATVAVREGWLPPAPPPSHPSDRGERPTTTSTRRPSTAEITTYRQWAEAELLRRGQAVTDEARKSLAMERWRLFLLTGDGLPLAAPHGASR